MSRGILFWSDGPNPVPLFPPAIKSLADHYDGNIHVIFGKKTPDWFINIISKNSRVSYSRYDKRQGSSGGKIVWRRCILEKPFVTSESPFKTSLFYDVDHIFINDIDMNIFNVIENNSIVTIEDSGLISKQPDLIKAANKLYGREENPILKTNGGCFGLLVNEEPHRHWQKTLHEISRFPGRNVFIEEHALALTMEKYGTRIGKKWSWNYIQPKHRSGNKGFKDMPDDAISVHFAHQRYKVSKFWRDKFLEAKNINYMGLDEHFDKYCECNIQVRSCLAMEDDKIRD